MDDLINALNYVENVTLQLLNLKTTAELVTAAWYRGTISEQHIILLAHACRLVDREVALSADVDLC